VTGTECLSRPHAVSVHHLPSDPIARAIRGSHLRLRHFWRLLELLASDGNRSQRELSQDLGTALGLTNQLLQAVITAGWVRTMHGEGHRQRYEVTGEGHVERRRLAHCYLQTCGAAYAELREHVHARLGQVIANLGSAPSDTRLVFYGRNEVAEVGYLCARGLGASVIGTVEESGTGSLVDVPCHSPEALDREQLAGQPFDCVVIMAFDGIAVIRAALHARRVPDERIATL
jgi:DNA-binding MarR family transcriptional regulator